MPDLPMTLFDLDAAGLDPRVPAPPEFIQFLYDNSRSGYLTLWSTLLSEPDGAPLINRWIQDALHVYYSRSLMTQMAPLGDKPSGTNVTEVTYSGPTTMPPPVCMEVPNVSGSPLVGAQLSCTMGIWGNQPTAYAYQWQSDGGAVGDGTSLYTVDATDDGKSIDCVVTATNVGGSTAAPLSNAVQIVGARAEPQEPAPDQHADYTTRSERDHDTTRSEHHRQRHHRQDE